MAKEVPVAMLDGTCQWVDSKDAAALAGLEKLPYDREYAGAIYQRPDGKFCYSEAVPGTNDNFSFKTDKSNGLTFAGLFHTHPGGPHEQKFSPNDVSVAEALKRTSYIRANDSGEVKRFDPGVSSVSRDKNPGSLVKSLNTSLGTPIGNISRREQLAQAYDLHNPADKL